MRWDDGSMFSTSIPLPPSRLPRRVNWLNYTFAECAKNLKMLLPVLRRFIDRQSHDPERTTIQYSLKQTPFLYVNTWSQPELLCYKEHEQWRAELEQLYLLEDLKTLAEQVERLIKHFR